MERYLRRNRLSDVMDGMGVCVLLHLLSLMWFAWLWGLNLPSIVAGAALGQLLCMARRQWRKRTVSTREKAMRCRLGAELMLEAMLMAEAREAHFRAALLLAERWPITLCTVQEEGVICRQGKETLLIRCIRMPPAGEMSMGDMIEAQRAARRVKAERVILCPLGKVSPKVAAGAEAALVPLRIIRRDVLMAIAGQYAPATDEQLIALGQRKRRPQGSVAALIFRRDKAPRYHLYGLWLLIFYVLTGFILYAIPGILCLGMGILCCILPGSRETL